MQVLDRTGRGHLCQRSRASPERRCVCGKARRLSHMTSPLLVLASASPRRNELLRQLGVTFQVVPGDVAEIVSESISPAEICQINAYRKARAVAKHYPDAVVLGADTLVCLDRSVFGKPADLNQAFSMLSMLQGQTHEVITGVCLLHLRDRRQ